MGAHEEMVAARVAVGGKWCFEHAPVGEIPWYKRINLDRLDMGSGWKCVLGQLFGEMNEHQFLNGYNWSLAHEGMNYDLAIEMGFYGCNSSDPDCDCSDQRAEELTAAWKDYIHALMVAEEERWINPDELAVSLGQMRRGEYREVPTWRDRLLRRAR